MSTAVRQAALAAFLLLVAVCALWTAWAYRAWPSIATPAVVVTQLSIVAGAYAAGRSSQAAIDERTAS